MRATIVAAAALVMVGCSSEGALVGTPTDAGHSGPADVPALGEPPPVSVGPGPDAAGDGEGNGPDGTSEDGGADGETEGDGGDVPPIGGGRVDGPDTPGGNGAIPCVTDFIWSTILVGSSEAAPFPSDLMPADTRAGTIEMNFNGGYGFDGVTNDPPSAAAILTLRNGAGALLEQFHLNRRFMPYEVDDLGCSTVKQHHECWLTVPDDLVDGNLVASLPALTGGSNEGFDSSGLRVRVEGSVRMNLDGIDASSPAKDNAHETFVARWVAPRGLDTARIFLVARFESALGEGGVKTVLVPLFAMRWPAEGPWRLAPGLRITELSDSAVTVTGTVEQALDDTCNVNMNAPCLVMAGQAKVGPQQTAWTLANGSSKPARISGLFIGLPDGAHVTAVRANGAKIAGAQASGQTFVDSWVGVGEARDVPPGGELTIEIQHTGAAVEPGAVRLLAATEAGCLLTPAK